MNHKGSHTPSHPHSPLSHVKKKRGNKAYAASVMTVLLGSALLLSACNPITAQHISLNASAGSGVGAGMMRGGMDGGRNAGMRGMMNADAIGRVVSVSGSTIKVELMESTRSSKRSEAANTGTSTTDTTGASTGAGAAAGTGNGAAQGIGNGSRSSEFGGTSASDYTTTGEQKTITLATNVQISEISSLMRQGGNAGGFGGGAPAGMGGMATGSPDANTGNRADTGNIGGAGKPAGGATGTMSTPNGNSEMKASDLQAGDIVMIWYKDDTQTAERITILPTE
ncbi:hypothetical protein [Paenibacillus kandeliae]|uniref:hypothetical protein n=1 Tax=Paenibacillus kandeliae TaxID=3231269 RepID=UPI0034598E0B